MATDEKKLKKIVDNIVGLPTLPTVLTNVTKMMQNPRVSAAQVGKVIQSDVALTSKILKLVNSAFYGFPNRISTVTHAIVILGFNAVRSTAMSVSVFDSFGGGGETEGFDRMAFWKHSIGCGAASRILAKRLNIKELEEAFIAGLLHDIGLIILDQFVHEEFVKVMKQVKEKDILIRDAEKELLDGVTHNDLGAWLGRKWNMAPALIEVIEAYPNPSSASDNYLLVSIVHAADILTRALDIGSGGDNRIPKINKSAWEKLGIDMADLPSILQEIVDSAKKAEAFFTMVNK
ncbi:MAG: HDOD domain-containing protein [Candidatus Aureabacteria bacterium]|nr:HDOD domain-containing protein [Candidatus Auribacterota bacterium]